MAYKEDFPGSRAVGADNSVIDSFISRVQSYADSGAKKKDPIDVLEMVMKKKGLGKNDLKCYLGSSGNVSDVLSRRRPLSLRMIRNLHFGLGIPAEELIRPYHCK